MKTENLYLYILMRTDLASMSTGRAAAQASHASNAFIHKYGKRKDVKSWQKQTKQGFGTAIVLGCYEDVMIDIVNRVSKEKDSVCECVIDPDYCITISKEIANLIGNENDELKFVTMKDDLNMIVSRRVTTCAYVFGDKEQLKPILGHLPLYP